ncbi:glycosyl transferase family 25 [Pasteurella langaaensis DSM 22999]|uniref:Glycosyl transferase family 25 n=1 Tax=Alitibacter langaaensis DSM 22999 TaxID=1122935 RepID=A0A2U0TA22_9PAST|nr:glycosyltransferase family 25 protein [Pasteurella langaaensis]PVX40461.1 glycosyl transferase family 25 [Pasteurella langaaensis DSM 22999]
MKKYLISLEKDVQRRALFFSQPDTSDFEIFNAINTMVLSEEELRDKFDFEQFKLAYHRNVTKGEIGCTLSHLSVYQKIVDDENIAENDYALVCEDDALFAEKFNENLTALLAENLQADIILVGQSKIPSFEDKELIINYPTTFSFLQKKIGKTKYRYAYPYKNYFAGTVAYLIKKSACRKFLSECNQNSVFWLADDFIYFERKLGLDILVVRPLMAIENPKLTSNLETLRGSLNNNLMKKLLKFPLKKLLAIKRNL